MSYYIPLTYEGCLQYSDNANWCSGKCYIFESDRQICAADDCPWQRNFRCASSEAWAYCYSSDEICDGIRVCPDGEDEQNCAPSLRKDYYEVDCDRKAPEVLKCNSGKCISYIWRCDGRAECLPDGEDEANCENFKSCDDYHCDDHTYCYGTSERCDLIYHCNDKTDELDCSMNIHTGRFLVFALPPLIGVGLLVLIIGILCCVVKKCRPSVSLTGYNDRFDWDAMRSGAPPSRTVRLRPPSPGQTAVDDNDRNRRIENRTSTRIETEGGFDENGEYHPPPRLTHEDPEYHPPGRASDQPEEPDQGQGQDRGQGQSGQRDQARGPLPNNGFPQQERQQGRRGGGRQGGRQDGRQDGRQEGMRRGGGRGRGRGYGRGEGGGAHDDLPSYNEALHFPRTEGRESTQPAHEDPGEALPSYESVAHLQPQSLHEPSALPRYLSPDIQSTASETTVSTSSLHSTAPPEYTPLMRQQQPTVSGAHSSPITSAPVFDSPVPSAPVFDSPVPSAPVRDTSVPRAPELESSAHGAFGYSDDLPSVPAPSYSAAVSAVPTSSVPSSTVPTSSVPTSAVPTSSEPTSTVPSSLVPCYSQDSRPSRTGAVIQFDEETEETIV